MKPTQILAKLCKDSKIEAPSYMNGTVRIGRKLFRIQSLDENNDWYRTKGEHFSAGRGKGCNVDVGNSKTLTIFCNPESLQIFRL